MNHPFEFHLKNHTKFMESGYFSSELKSLFNSKPKTHLKVAINEPIQCLHIDSIDSKNHLNCKHCGAFISKDGVVAIKEYSRRSKLEYDADTFIKNMIRQKCYNKKFISQLNASEISLRRKIVDWICQVGEQIGISIEYVHRAVVYLDRIMDVNMINEDIGELLAIICLILSTKMGEEDEKVYMLNKIFKEKVKDKRVRIKEYEIQVLSLLEWDLNCVTPLDFIEIFAYEGLVFEKDIIKGKNPTNKVASVLRQYSEFLADMCLQEYTSIKIPSIKLAAGIIATARKILKINRIWNPELTVMTGLEYKDIFEICDYVYNTYKKLFGKNKRENLILCKENICPNNLIVNDVSRNSNLSGSGAAYKYKY